MCRVGKGLAVFKVPFLLLGVSSNLNLKQLHSGKLT